MHGHHDWFIATLAFIFSLACAAYVVYEIRKDRNNRNR